MDGSRDRRRIRAEIPPVFFTNHAVGPQLVFSVADPALDSLETHDSCASAVSAPFPINKTGVVDEN
jgi:hypothetical protein